MRKNKSSRVRNGFSQTICKFFNIFTLCSRQSPSCIVNKDRSNPNTFMISTPVIKQSKIHVSPSRTDYNHLKLSFYPTRFTSIDQGSFSHHLMPQIVLVDSEFFAHNNDMMRHVATNDNRPCREEPASPFSSTPSSSPTSNCHSSSTIHQYYSRSTSPSATTTNIEMFSKRSDHGEKSAEPFQAAARLSYLIRPSTPCIFGRENYDDDESINEDEFFLTAGGIIHSCPNIYELTMDNDRKLQSCDHLMFIDQQTTLVNDDLNSYDTELDRYSILPRFHLNLAAISAESIDSELKLYKERHAMGFSRPCPEDYPMYSSFLPTTWKSDNYLLFMPNLSDHNPHHHYHLHPPSLLNTPGHEQRSRSYEVPIKQTYTSVIV